MVRDQRQYDDETNSPTKRERLKLWELQQAMVDACHAEGLSYRQELERIIAAWLRRHPRDRA